MYSSCSHLFILTYVFSYNPIKKKLPLFSYTDTTHIFHDTKLLFYGATGGGKEWRGAGVADDGVAESKQ